MSEDPVKPPQSAFRVALIYVVVAGCWILFSDELLQWLVRDPEERTRISICKGWGFVLVTGGLLYWMLRHWLRQLAGEKARIQLAEAAWRETAEKLRQNEEQLRYLGDNLPHAMLYQVQVERDGRRRFCYVSQGVRAMHGCSPAEAESDAAHIYGSVLAEDRERLDREEQLALTAMTTFTTELRIQKPSGEVRWSQIVSRPRKLEGGAVFWDGIEIDITDRKQVEMELRESEAKLRGVFECSRDAIGIGLRGTHVFANPA